MNSCFKCLYFKFGYTTIHKISVVIQQMVGNCFQKSVTSHQPDLEAGVILMFTKSVTVHMYMKLAVLRFAEWQEIVL